MMTFQYELYTLIMFSAYRYSSYSTEYLFTNLKNEAAPKILKCASFQHNGYYRAVYNQIANEIQFLESFFIWQ